MLARIVPFTQSFDELWLDYLIPEALQADIQLGLIVEIYIWKKQDLWVVLEIIQTTTIKQESLKSIEWIYDSQIYLGPIGLELLRYTAKLSFSHIHHVLQVMMPKNLKEKIKKQKIDISDISTINYDYNNSFKLTGSQEKARISIVNNTSDMMFLLFWVTGSGKTQIYIDLIHQTLLSGKQSLLLIPEIILTNQISQKIIDIFWKDVLVINSTVSEAKKTKMWVDIRNSNAKIIIGTRSALFYPYQDLGIIIIDEEHDNSYVSDNTPRYKSVIIAEKLSTLHNCKLILGSGTPSISSMHKAVTKKYKLIQLLGKYKAET